MNGATDISGELLGPWLVQARIGTGGQGEIYRAVRMDGTFQQTVAIKVLYEAFPSAWAMRRFEEEQESLASLHHPFIANLLGTGVTAAGKPYFAMEHIAGQPIDQYANERGLSLPQRLALFRKVCEAVTYAHSRLIVHLDLKPANILVTAEGFPKLLDFGLARRLTRGGAGASAEIDAFSGAYASPEQVTPGSPLSTLSDVYSLGAILYELVAGHLAIPVHSSGEAAVHAIREMEPVKPSLAAERPRRVLDPAGRVFELSVEKIAAMRGLSPAELARRLSGDLDNIALVALRKEPGRRYPSVEELARDIDRHLSGKPVHARASSPAYQAIRAARRSPIIISASVLICSALLANAVMPRALQQSTDANIATIKSIQAETCQVARDLDQKVAPLANPSERTYLEGIIARIRRQADCPP